MKINLRDRFGNMWPVGVNKIGGNLYFQYGWEKFIEDNSVEVGDFLVFDYDGNKMFDFKLLGRTKCEKNGVGGLKAEEMIVEHQKSRESKEKNWASDSCNSFSSYDNDVEYMGERDEDEDEDEDKDEEYKETKKVACYVEDEEEDDEDEEEEDEGENQRTNTHKKEALRSKGKHQLIFLYRLFSC